MPAGIFTRMRLGLARLALHVELDLAAEDRGVEGDFEFVVMSPPRRRAVEALAAGAATELGKMSPKPPGSAVAEPLAKELAEIDLFGRNHRPGRRGIPRRRARPAGLPLAARAHRCSNPLP